jgi:NAD(P)-dependent dehydrogenase (short-subunit alcohol dehydrogenase family)
MESFKDLFGVVTGGGSGIGRGLVLQLAREGCQVAFCDVNQVTIDETVELAKKESPNVKVTGYICDVTNEEAWIEFREECMKAHEAKYVNLLFCNAGW